MGNDLMHFRGTHTAIDGYVKCNTCILPLDKAVQESTMYIERVTCTACLERLYRETLVRSIELQGPVGS